MILSNSLSQPTVGRIYRAPHKPTCKEFCILAYSCLHHAPTATVSVPYRKGEFSVMAITKDYE